MRKEALLDVRSVSPRERHPLIFKAWEAVPVGSALKLVNDHDPKPLFYQFQAERPGEFQWTALESGPVDWVVEIKRVAPGASSSPLTGAELVKDVSRRSPAAERVFAEYGLDLCCGGEHSIRVAAAAKSVDAEELLAKLNAALSAPAKACCPQKAAPAWSAKTPDVEVDVREDLRQGREPFQKIMAAVARVAPGGVLLLRAIMDPKPLYQVLGRQGFEAWPVREAEDDWKIYFHKEPKKGQVYKVDVCGLEPPEPMTIILSKARELGPADVLEVKHFREPLPLYAYLEEGGFDHDIKKLDDGFFLLRIKRKP